MKKPVERGYSENTENLQFQERRERQNNFQSSENRNNWVNSAGFSQTQENRFSQARYTRSPKEQTIQEQKPSEQSVQPLQTQEEPEQLIRIESVSSDGPKTGERRTFSPKLTTKFSVNEMDAELERILQQHRATIKVVGCGGSGNNTINRITEVGIAGAESIAINTDAQDLLYTSADKKILIGKEITRGLGAGSDPKIGEEATRESESDIKKTLQGSDMIFLTCGLGGGTGTGSIPVIAEIAKKVGALTVGIVTLPFSMEGQRRYENAMIGLEKLEQSVDTLIVIPNDKLLELAPDLPLHTAFKVADEILTNAVKGIAEMVTKAGLVNLDFADIRAVMGKGGMAMIGVGESDTDNRAVEAVEKAISNPLLDVDISGANGALINVAGGPDMTLNEAKKVVETVTESLDPDAKIIWGAQIYGDLQRTIRAMLIVTGVKSSQILGNKKAKKGGKEIGDELGIEFVD